MGRTVIDMENDKLILRVRDKQEIFNIYNSFEQPHNVNYCYIIDEEELPNQRNCQNRKSKFDELLDKDKNGDYRILRAKRECIRENYMKCKSGISLFELP